MRRGLWPVALFVAVTGCSETTSSGSPVREAELGVFYGGQVQQLRHVPWPADGPQPTLGFRLTFSEPLVDELPVSWEVDMPARSAPGRRIQKIQETRAVKGQQRLDQSIEVPPTAELGTWNIRVVVADRLVVDRAVRLFSPATR